MLHVSKLEIDEVWCSAGCAGRELSPLATPLMHSEGLTSSICVPGRGGDRAGRGPLCGAEVHPGLNLMSTNWMLV